MTQCSDPLSGTDTGQRGVIATSSVRRWTVMTLLFLASVINYLDRATISVALPYISADLHLGPESKGLVLSSFFWLYALMQIPVGWCTDRLNLRWMYAAHFAVWSLACGFTGFAGSLAVLMVLRILLGFGESIYLPGGSKIVAVLFPSQDRGLPSGFFDSGTRVGLAVGAPLVAMLVVKYGWRRMFALVGFAALAWVVPWLLAAPRNLQGVRKTPPAGVSTGSAPRRRIRFSRKLVGICIGFFGFDYYWYLLVTWLPDYLVTVRHLPLMRAGIYAALPYCLFAILQPIGGGLTDWLIRRGYDETRTRKTVLTISFLTGLLLIPAVYAHSQNAVLAFLLGTSFVGLGTGNLLPILQACAPPDGIGIWTGIENFVGNVGGVLAPLVTGYLIATTGSYAPGFAFAAILLVAGQLSYWFVVGELKPDVEPPW